VSPLLCKGVSSLYCGYKIEPDNSDSGNRVVAPIP
jgi:hypothetical protein